MFARPALVPTAEEMAQRYYEGIDLGGNLYDADAADIHGHLPDPERDNTARPSDMDGLFSIPNDTEGPFFGRSDMEGSYSERTDTEGSEPKGGGGGGGGGGSGSGRRRVRFTLPRQPGPGGDSDPEGCSGSPRRRRPIRLTLPRQPRPGGDSQGGDAQVRKNINTTLFNFNRPNDFSTKGV